MKYIITAILFALAVSVSAPAHSEPTDLVIQIIWQNSEGTVVDKKYLRVFVGPTCNTDNKERVLWSSREGHDMVGRVMCLEAGAPIPSIEIGEFTVTTPEGGGG